MIEDNLNLMMLEWRVVMNKIEMIKKLTKIDKTKTFIY